MAGPGGGPPRKSHTKSRKGCKTCKRRHIRCDESFPQCRNCTKHSCRCDYMDQPTPTPDEAPRSPLVLDLLWSPANAAEIDNWIRTAQFPFPELNLVNHQQFQGLTRNERRLLHHVGAIHRDLHRKGLARCTPWITKLNVIMELASSHDFVLHAMLSMSAMHLAAESQNSETAHLAYLHKGTAFGGLQTALSAFSPANSDPILAASILLSWQASDWPAWTSLMQGITSVLSSMGPWKETSMIAHFIEEMVLTPEREPFFVPPVGLGAPMLPEDDHSILDAITTLNSLRIYVQNDQELIEFVEEILGLTREIELCSRTMRPEQLFEKLQILRLRVLWSPVRLVQAIDQTNMNLLCVAHLYAAAMAVDASLPELNGAALGALTMEPLEEIDRRLRFTSPNGFDPASTIQELMRFPRAMVTSTRATREASTAMAPQPADIINPAAGGRQSPYGLQNLHLDSAPTTPDFPPTFPLFAPSISTEDLSVPPSPFLQSFVPGAAAGAVAAGGLPGSRRHSGLIQAGTPPRPNSMSFDRRSFSSFSGLGQAGDSPSYSPAAHSPAPSHYLEEDHNSLFGDGSPSWGGLAGGGFAYDDSAEKGKGHATF